MVAVVFSAATNVAASDDSRARFHFGGKHTALLGGYGHGFRMGSSKNRKKSRELGKVRLAEVVPRFGIGVTDPLGLDGVWYRGNFEVLFEGALIWNAEPRSGFAGGAGTTLRYNFLRWRRVVPYFDANFGVLGVDFDLERQSDGFNFNVGFGTGAHWFLNERTAIDTEVRWQHISNADTKQPNDGINAVLFLLGVSYFFD